MNDEQIPLFDQEEPTPDLYPGAFLSREDQTLQLVSVGIDGLKGFDKVEIELQPLTILTGPNNSGKSTVLQAIALAFECFRRCLDIEHWRLRTTGRAVAEFEFLPVNQPKDLWFKQIWKPSKDRERYVRVGLRFSNDFRCVLRIRFLYGFLNIGLETAEPTPDEAILKGIATAGPILLPATPGPSAHEEHISLAQIHRLLTIREPNRVVRNILLLLQDDQHRDEREFISNVLEKYFGTRLEEISFNEIRDLEIRAPVREEDYALDVVSAGSGLNQILQLAAIISWRKPGIVLLDEPDAHLHSSVQAQLLDFLTELVDSFHLQVILATHSRDLIGQAPLQAIVPVDRSRSKLTPLASLDHLLLEYQRQGTITNVDLALLYQTKRCIFVEGPTDSRLLPRIAERLKVPLFVGSEQAVLFEFEGIDKLKLLPDLVRLFERLVGAKLRWGVIRDSDANIPKVKEHHAKLAKEWGIPVFHQWSCYSLENYLLETEFLLAAAKKRRGSKELNETIITEMLEKAVQQIEGEVLGPFITKTQVAYRNFELAENPFDTGATEATLYLKSLTALNDKLAAYPGKKIFGAFVEILQNDYGINLRLEDVVAEITPENAPRELKECFSRLGKI